ncbi:MAG: hypothetical protein ACFHU9_03695 [Fluviicola sp.]
MNILKNVIVGVVAVVWNPNIMTCRILYRQTTYQDSSDVGSVPAIATKRISCQYY